MALKTKQTACTLWFLFGLLVACNRSSVTVTPDSGLAQARQALLTFFDALAKDDYQAASGYFRNYDTLQATGIQAEDPAAILQEACALQTGSCQFYCWPIKDILEERDAAPLYTFTVRFEKDGVLLSGGDNRTPAPVLPRMRIAPAQSTPSRFQP